MNTVKPTLVIAASVLVVSCAAPTYSPLAQSAATPTRTDDHPLPPQPMPLAPLSPQSLLTYTIRGSIRLPGRFVWSGPVHLSRAIEAAGGFTESANRTRLTIYRQSGSVDRYSYSRIAEEPGGDPLVFPGDTVEIPQRRFIW